MKEPKDEDGKNITQKLMQMMDYDGVPPGYNIELVGFQLDKAKAVFEGCQVRLHHKEGNHQYQQGLEDCSGQLFLLKFATTPPRPLLPGNTKLGSQPVAPKKRRDMRSNRRKECMLRSQV